MQTPTLRRRLACNLYESLLLTGILFIAAFLFVALTLPLPVDTGLVLRRFVLWVFLLFVAGFYFTLFWRKGQTLAMKTWGIRLIAEQGGSPTTSQLWKRYALACINLTLLGIGWWIAPLRPDGQFLQDHYAGTRLISDR